MDSTGSVTHWLHLLSDGVPEAAQQLWERYFRRLVTLAKAKLNGFPRRVADEEDLALSAFDSFCRGVAQNRYPQLSDRDNLWRLLATITARKVLNLKRDQQRQKRGGARDADRVNENLELVLGHEPTPEFAAQVADELTFLLNALDDDHLRRLAVLKMEGWTNKEIADQVPCSPRTVERRLELIRSIWEKKGIP